MLIILSFHFKNLNYKSRTCINDFITVKVKSSKKYVTFGVETSFWVSINVFANFFFRFVINEAKKHPNHIYSYVQQTSLKYSQPLFKAISCLSKITLNLLTLFIII